MKKITSFQGPYRFLSNFWPAVVELDGLWYTTVEHAYQAAKTHDLEERMLILRQHRPGDAKRVGRLVTVSSDWEERKLPTMRSLVARKFDHHSLAQRLLDTGVAHLEEGNNWGDTYWGVCRGVGSNHLGKILMHVRRELREERSC